MLHDILGVALIGVGALSMVARVMGRAAELQRLASRRSLRLATEGGAADQSLLQRRS
jgi:hypothetical protein